HRRKESRVKFFHKFKFTQRLNLRALETALLKKHVIFWGKAYTRAQNVFNRGPLPEKCVDNLCSIGNEWRFQEVGKHREHRVERRKLVLISATIRNALEQFGKQHKVQHNWSRKEAVFAGIVD